jgi:hypothetical protein
MPVIVCTNYKLFNILIKKLLKKMELQVYKQEYILWARNFLRYLLAFATLPKKSCILCFQRNFWLTLSSWTYFFGLIKVISSHNIICINLFYLY